MNKQLEIGIFCVEPTEPFIYWVNGEATIETLGQIEGSLTEILGEQIIEASQSGYNLKAKAIYVPSEQQYGTGYGDVLTIHSYFDLEIIEKIPFDVPEEAEPWRYMQGS